MICGIDSQFMLALNVLAQRKHSVLILHACRVILIIILKTQIFIVIMCNLPFVTLVDFQVFFF